MAEDASIELMTGPEELFVATVHRVVEGVSPEKAQAIFEQHLVEIRKTGNSIKIHLQKKPVQDPEFWLIPGGSFHTKISIIVPEKFNAELSTSNGFIAVMQLDGELRVNATQTEILMSDITGPVSASTTSGDISLEGSSNTVVISNIDGSIRIGEIEGDVYLKTSQGEISVEAVTGKVDAYTSGGDIVVAVIRRETNDYRLQTTNGRIELEINPAVAVIFDAVTSDGVIVNEFELSEFGSIQRENRLYGKLNGGGPVYSLRATMGNIEIKRIDKL